MGDKRNYVVISNLVNHSFSSYGSNDAGKKTISQINARDERYTDLLVSYVGITKWRNVLKEIHKWVFFWLVIAACTVGLVLAGTSISRIFATNDQDYIIDAIPVIIAAFVSIATTVIAIPLAITNFLFNSKEDENITDLIKHTQEHDAASRELLREHFLLEKSSNQPVATTVEKKKDT